MNREKEKLEQVLLICSKCEENAYYKGRKKLCRNIHISEKIGTGFGCGKWKKDGEFILDQEFYDEIRKRVKLKQVINDLIKGEII